MSALKSHLSSLVGFVLIVLGSPAKSGKKVWTIQEMGERLVGLGVMSASPSTRDVYLGQVLGHLLSTGKVDRVENVPPSHKGAGRHPNIWSLGTGKRIDFGTGMEILDAAVVESVQVVEAVETVQPLEKKESLSLLPVGPMWGIRNLATGEVRVMDSRQYEAVRLVGI